MKLCCKCNTEKAFTEYRKDKNRKNGIDIYCKECRNAMDRVRYAGSPDKKKEYIVGRYSKGLIKYKRDDYLKQKESGKKRARDINRRALLNKADGKITKDVIKYLLQNSDGRCFYCGVGINNEYHVDHYIPLSRGGNNKKENLRISCPTCNYRKGSRLISMQDEIPCP